MNKQQFKRLTFVVTLPLLALGAWMASEETFIDADHVSFCEEFATHFSCHSINTTTRKAQETIWQDRNVSLMRAVLVNGFNHRVRTLGWQEGNQVVGAGTVKQLVLPQQQSSATIASASCRLAPRADAPNKWSAECGSQVPVSFEFVDAAVAEKFDVLAKTVRVERDRLTSNRVKLLAIATLIPLASYFALSLLVFIAVRLVRYVRGPVAPVHQKQ